MIVLFIETPGFPDSSGEAAPQRVPHPKAIDMAITLIALCLAIMTISILGGLLPLATVFNHTRLQVYLSFSAGTMLGAAFFHMLPEAVRVGSATTIHWAAVGLLSLFFLERFFSFHHHEPHTPTTVTDPHAGCAEHSEHPTNRDHAATHAIRISRFHRLTILRRVALGIGSLRPCCSFTRRRACIASAVAADYEIGAGLGKAGLGVFVATLVHKPADALTITSLMLRAGSTRWSALIVNIAFGLMIPRVLSSSRWESGDPFQHCLGVDRRRLGFFGRHVPVHCTFRPAA